MLLGLATSSTQETAQIPISSEGVVCEHPPYRIQLVSSSPLIIYIHNFLTENERTHLRSTRQVKDKFRNSVVAADSTSGAAVSKQRSSQSTYVSTHDPIVHCIEERALVFQGYDIPRSHLEPLQLVKYAQAGDHYHFHTDWFTDPVYSYAFNGGNRVSSFFAYVYVSNDTTGGGTNFPLVETPRDERWCGTVVDCDKPWENGVTFRPIEGNAVFWKNLHDDGTGNQKTLHAGLPVTSGEKIGMNIWTRQAPLNEEAKAPDEYPDL
ncbi:hypothetical protein QBC46DRAFT_251808 [Diplogelasinospora grovesii]|uniref:Fe2OG dioxygenase domain-containing protein n=1 Tax=Diplogelasinospora grovesii TaxID=303347 RepID=A0AAN6NG06_9PEZI|nr:hypothetical protein QBC46DRAFT_251808 [Diplogelasinospora grovesii]